MDKKGLLLYLDTIPQWKMMSDAQAGALIKALLDYADTGKPLESDDTLVMMAFAFISAQVDRADESYRKKCERNKKVAENRWKKNTEAEAEAEEEPEENAPEDTTDVPEDTTEYHDVPESTKKCLPNPITKSKSYNQNISFLPASGEKKEKNEVPSVEDVKKFVTDNGFNVDPQKFVATYSANGWVTSSGQKIKDWRAMVQVWHINACSGLLPRDRTSGGGDSGTSIADGTASFDISDLEKMANRF